MTGLTLAVVVVVLAAVSGRISYAQAAAIGAITPAGAALVVGATAVPTFYAVSLALAGAMFLGVMGFGRLSSREPLPPGGVILVAFLAWSTMVTLAAPLLFDGLLVVHPSAQKLQAGVLTSSNFAQLAYLFLGICVAVVLSRTPGVGPSLLGLALGSTLTLAFARYLALEFNLPFPEGLFDNSPRFNYIETSAGGDERFRGIHSEPAALASSCVTGIAYFSLRAGSVRGWRRAGCVGLIVAAVWMGIESTSATFVVAGLIAGALFTGAVLVQFAARRTTARVSIGIAACGAIVAAAVLAPRVLAFVQSTVDDKLGSDSYSARSSTDTLSLGVFLDTFGFGVGLGSARGSSFLPTVLSAVGIVGTLLLAAALFTIIRGARHRLDYRPVTWALIAFLIVKLTSSPDLSGPDATLWLSLGLLSGAAMHPRAAGEHARAPDSRVTAERESGHGTGRP